MTKPGIGAIEIQHQSFKPSVFMDQAARANNKRASPVSGAINKNRLLAHDAEVQFLQENIVLRNGKTSLRSPRAVN